MRIIHSNTSSNGNCSVIESESGALLTIDAGIRYDVVNRAIGYNLHLCRTLLLSHAHKDHCFFASEYRKRGMIQYAGPETCKKIGGTQLPMQKAISVPGFDVISFPLVHTDSTGEPCECLGFLIRDSTSEEMLLWCTDTAYIPFRFPSLDVYALEANFWEQTDYSDILDSIEKSVEIRRNKSHMSVETMVSFLQKQDLSKCKEIRLLHLSHSMTAEEKSNIIPFIQERIKRSDIKIGF